MSKQRETIQKIAQSIRDRYYGGEMSREVAFQTLGALMCETVEFTPGESRDVRALKASLMVVAFMEPAID